MSGLGELLTLAWLFRKGARGAVPSPDVPPYAGPMPAGTSPEATAPATTSPDATTPGAGAPGATPGAAPPPNLPWPQGPIPASLPPFPGPGWEYAPVTSETSARATYWNGLLWDFASKTMRKPYVQENFGGVWMTWAAAWHPDATGAPKKLMATEAWRVKQAPAATAPAPAPVPVTVQPSQQAAATAPPLMAVPGVAPTVVRPATQYEVTHVQPYPGPGAWQSNAAYVKRYQVALDALGIVGKDGKPLTVDGKVGPNTDYAVRAFQGSMKLKVDGQAGPETAKAIDAALDALAASHG